LPICLIFLLSLNHGELKMTQTEKKESTTQTATGSYQAKHGRYGLSTHTDIRAGNVICHGLDDPEKVELLTEFFGQES